MAILYFPNVFTLGADQFTVVRAWINGEAESGGEYHGPVVITAIPTGLNQRVVTSDVDIRFTARMPDGFTSKCFYEFRVDNIESFPVSFTCHMFKN